MPTQNIVQWVLRIGVFGIFAGHGWYVFNLFTHRRNTPPLRHPCHALHRHDGFADSRHHPHKTCETGIATGCLLGIFNRPYPSTIR
jgi:hypothetical protein